MRLKQPLTVALLTAAVVAASACATAPPRQPLPLQSAPSFSSSGGAARSDPWWQDFHDPVLSELVERALTNNFTLRGAYERTVAARALASRDGAARFPTLDLSAEVSRTDASDADPDRESGVALQASYEADLWGRVRKGVEAGRLEADATAEDYQAAAISLSAEIAATLYQLTEASAQLTLLESQLRTNRDVLAVIESRFAIGQSGSADVLRQRQLVEATVEQQALSRASRQLLEHRLHVLLGEPPQGAPRLGTPPSLPDVPELPEVGPASDLLQRRPDVRAAYLRLASADASVAAAVRDRYPSLNLGAAVSTTAEKPSGLFSSWLTSVAGQLLAPVVDGGRRRREVDRTAAVRRQRLLEYGETVLASFQEVEDALTREQYEVERSASLERRLGLARATYAELRNGYLNGATDFIDVLVALGDQQDLERTVLSARLARIEQRIALHRALAGGFLNPDPAAATEPGKEP